jgi:hypothetical protein
MSTLARAEFFRDRLAIESEGYRGFDLAKCQSLFAEFRQNDTWQVAHADRAARVGTPGRLQIHVRCAPRIYRPEIPG